MVLQRTALLRAKGLQKGYAVTTKQAASFPLPKRDALSEGLLHVARWLTNLKRDYCRAACLRRRHVQMHGTVTHRRSMLDSGMAIPLRLISSPETHYTQQQPARRRLANCLPI